jgi:hypothetical protein
MDASFTENVEIIDSQCLAALPKKWAKGSLKDYVDFVERKKEEISEKLRNKYKFVSEADWFMLKR